MPRQTTARTLKARGTAKPVKESEELPRLPPERVRKARAILNMEEGLHSKNPVEHRAAVLTILIHDPDEQEAVKLLKSLRQNQKKKGLHELFGLTAPLPGRRAGHTGDFWCEAFVFYWADCCELSRKEILYHFGKTNSLQDSLDPNQHRYVATRIEAAKKWYQTHDKDEAVRMPFLLYFRKLTKEVRKARAIKMLQKSR